MTLILDDLKQYQTQNWWRKCAVYLQKTATWQRVNVNKTFFFAKFVPLKSHKSSEFTWQDAYKDFLEVADGELDCFCLAVWIEIERLPIWRSEERDGRIEYGN
jgi:hypothetical protein